MDKSLTVFFDSENLYREFLSVCKLNGNKITAIQSAEKCRLYCGHLLIVCCKNTKKLPEIISPCDVTVILDSECRLILRENEAENYKFITCGYSSKDSVTLSSITNEKSVVSIQRGFINFNGNRVEPMDLVIDCNYRNCGNMLPIVTAQLFCCDKLDLDNSLV